MDDESDEGSQVSCVDCACLSPVSHGTLLSARGWRVLRRRDHEGRVVAIEWRCPSCYDAFKRAGGDLSIAERTPIGGSHPSSHSRPPPRGVATGRFRAVTAEMAAEHVANRERDHKNNK